MHGAGVYKPRVRCYETAELSMKFERAMDSEVVQFQILGEDWRKVCCPCVMSRTVVCCRAPYAYQKSPTPD